MKDSGQSHQLLTYPVPPGYAAMSMPCDPQTRLKLDRDFVLRKAEERDLLPFVRRSRLHRRFAVITVNAATRELLLILITGSRHVQRISRDMVVALRAA